MRNASIKQVAIPKNCYSSLKRERSFTLPWTRMNVTSPPGLNRKAHAFFHLTKDSTGVQEIHPQPITKPTVQLTSGKNCCKRIIGWRSSGASCICKSRKLQWKGKNTSRNNCYSHAITNGMPFER